MQLSKTAIEAGVGSLKFTLEECEPVVDISASNKSLLRDARNKVIVKALEELGDKFPVGSIVRYTESGYRIAGEQILAFSEVTKRNAYHQKIILCYKGGA